MKRKIFSKLLMVALVIASVSAFVSCKDYDDDINNLQKQIDAKAAISQIETLQTQLSAAQSAAQAAATAAENALKEAQAKTTDAAVKTAIDAAIEKVNKAAEEAATKNAEAIKAAADAAAAAGADAKAAADAAAEAKEAAEKAYTDALEAIKAEIAKISIPDVSGFLTKAQIEALIKENAQAKGEYVTATSLATQLDELKKTIPGAVDLTEINNAIASYDGAISALYSAVTSVELIGSYTAAGANGGLAANNIGAGWTANNPLNLNLTHGTVGENSIFGDNEAWREAAPTVTYTEGADIKFEQGIVVRVNPVTADLTNAKILLVNSKGEAIDDYVVAGTPTRYNRIISRGSSVNSGLWVIPFEMAKSGVTAKDFYDNVSRTGYRYDALGNLIVAGTRILYAVAVNNTFDASEDRYAVSSYDVATTYNPYVAARTFTYHVDDEKLENIRNRWDGTKTLAEQANANTYLEQIWQVSDAGAASPKHITPATAIVTTPAANKNVLDATTANATAVGGGTKLRDARAMGTANPLPVEIGVPFTIDNIAAYTTEAGYEADGTYAYTAADTKVEWYYVVLDKTHAIESIPSEENAWLSYDITGLNTMTKATDPLDITINSASAKGDIIGFRVYAVNYDGTLADPDGRAFYVCPGDPANVNAVNVPYTATLSGATGVAVTAAGIKAGNNNKSAFVEIPSDMTFTDANGVAFAAFGTKYINPADFPAYLNGATGITVNWALYKDAAGNNAATKWSEVKYIKIVVDNPQNQVDNSTVSFTINGKADAAHGNAVVNSLRVNVTKELPNSKNTNIVWRTSLEPDANNVLTVYPLAAQSAGVATTAIANVKWPSAGANRAASWNVATAGIKYASVDLAGYANDLNAADTYWEVSNVKQDGTAKTVKVLGKVLADVETADVFDNFVLKMDKTMVGQTVDAVIKSNYKNISAPTLAKTGAAAEDVPFTAWTGKIKFEDGIEKLLKLEATSYIQNYRSATKTQDDKTPAKSNAYYYFWKDGAVTPIVPAPLWGYITANATAPQGGYTLDNALMKWIDGNATWTDASKTVAYTTAPSAFVTTTKVYEYEKIFTPVWGVRTNAADLKRQVLAEYVGLYDVSANAFPETAPGSGTRYTLSNYLTFKKPSLSETAPAVKAATTLVEAINYSTGGVVKGFQIQNLVGNVPTADVTCKLKIQGEDIFGYQINDDNLSMSFIIKPLKKTDY